MHRTALWFSLTFPLVGCSGRYEVGENADSGSSAGRSGMVEEGTGGGAAGGGGAVGSGAVGSGGKGQGAGGVDGGGGTGTGAVTGTAGAPTFTYCVSRTNLPALEPPFRPPSDVWRRISILVLGTEVAPLYELPQETTVDWAGTVALQALATAAEQADGAQVTVLFLRSWMGMDAEAPFAQNWGQLASANGATLATLISRVDPVDRTRIGIFSDENWLTRYPRATLRGKTAILSLFGQVVPPPPAGVTTAISPDPGEGLTRRQRLVQQHTSSPECTACHNLMDPLGFAFENFDETGKYRAKDNGQPVDASGAVTHGGDQIKFTSALDLMPQLDASCDVARPLARAFYDFAVQRVLQADLSSLEGPDYEDDVDRVTQAFAKDRFRLRALTRAVAQSRAFLR